MAEPGTEKYLLAAVMGWPALHSRSPVLHGYWFGHYGLKGSYLPLEIAPDGLEAALRALPALGFAGCNLTIPHKVSALSLVDDMDEAARAIGAVNCVTVRQDGSLSGSNTDGYGFLANVEATVADWRASDGPAVVIGAGGAARSILYSLMDAGAPDIRIVNRTREKAEALAAAFDGPVTVHDWAERSEILDGAALVVNTTSLGMEGQPPLDLALDSLPKGAVVSDIVYVPLMTPLLAEAENRGNRTVDGLGMLLHQARPCWRDWFGIDPEVTDELRQTVLATF